MTQQALQLLEHGLKDMYDAENKFVDALSTMLENANDRSLSDGFRRHREVTQNQAHRLERAFHELGREPETEDCAGASGLIKEYEDFVKGQGRGNGLHDAFAASAGLKVEYYEIASYRALIDLAEFCDQDKVARLLKQNLAEEEQAAAEMQSAATKLGAKLAGASTAAVAGRAVGGMIDRTREGVFATVGGARAVGETAVGGARKALRKAERRGRKVTAQRKSAASTTRTKGRKARTTARRTASAAKSTTRRTAKTAHRQDRSDRRTPNRAERYR